MTCPCDPMSRSFHESISFVEPCSFAFRLPVQLVGSSPQAELSRPSRSCSSISRVHGCPVMVLELAKSHTESGQTCQNLSEPGPRLGCSPHAPRRSSSGSLFCRWPVQLQLSTALFTRVFCGCSCNIHSKLSEFPVGAWDTDA